MAQKEVAYPGLCMCTVPHTSSTFIISPSSTVCCWAKHVQGKIWIRLDWAKQGHFEVWYVIWDDCCFHIWLTTTYFKQPYLALLALIRKRRRRRSFYDFFSSLPRPTKCLIASVLPLDLKTPFDSSLSSLSFPFPKIMISWVGVQQPYREASLSLLVKPLGKTVSVRQIISNT